MNSLNIVGTGILLKTVKGTYLFQERDAHLERNPGKIAPFGGGMNEGETPGACAIRELAEELELTVSSQDLEEVGVFESHFALGTYIQLFLVKNVNVDTMHLHEGRQIKEMSIEEALQNPQVTDFTKEVLMSVR